MDPLSAKAALALAAAILGTVPISLAALPDAAEITSTAMAAASSSSDLEVGAASAEDAKQGGPTTVRVIVANTGPEVTARPFTVFVTLPPAVHGKAGFYPDDCVHDASWRFYSCRFPAGLGVLRSAAVTIPAMVDRQSPLGVVNGGSVQVFSPDDLNASNNQRSYTVAVAPAAAG